MHMFFNKNEGWFFVIPLLIWLSLSILFPLYIAVDLSFYNVKIIGTEGKFYGFKNYIKLLNSSKFWSAFNHSLLWVLGNAIAQTFFAFLIALTLNKKFSFQKIATNWIILSFIIPTVVIVVIWKLMLSSSSGIINATLINVNIIDQPIRWYVLTDDSSYASEVLPEFVQLDFDMPTTFSLMAVTRNIILSPSTFSLAASLINPYSSSPEQARDKLCIAPKYWGGFNMSQWYPKDFISPAVHYLEV